MVLVWLPGSHSEGKPGRGIFQAKVRSRLIWLRCARLFSTLQLFIDSVPHFIAFVDAQQRYQMVNHNYEGWFGVPRSQLIGRSWLKCTSPKAMRAWSNPSVR